MDFARPEDEEKLAKAMDMLEVSELSNRRLTLTELSDFAIGYYQNRL